MTNINLKHAEITEQIIHAFYNVYNDLGYGFLEKVYENAMAIELRKHDLTVIKQKRIQVHFSGELVGEYYADLLVENLVIVELKAARVLVESHEVQLLNYLKATDNEIGLLLNFGPEPKVKRKIFSN